MPDILARLIPLALAAAVLVPALGNGPARAGQPYFEMTCDELWYERNAIYAHYGYCFKTARAQAVFGTSCHPPYGKLPKSAMKQVKEIKSWERKKGCS